MASSATLPYVCAICTLPYDTIHTTSGLLHFMCICEDRYRLLDHESWSTIQELAQQISDQMLNFQTLYRWSIPLWTPEQVEEHLRHKVALMEHCCSGLGCGNCAKCCDRQCETCARAFTTGAYAFYNREFLRPALETEITQLDSCNLQHSA